MKVSITWLQKYFAEPLTPTDALVEALTFHSCEVEEVIGEGADTMLDIKVLPDRAPYALSHRGIAYELAAALNLPLAEDPLRSALPDFAAVGGNARITVSIDDPNCLRYMAARVSGVTVGPSPEWLKTALTRVGQRSINNVVDATNYVMLNIGQPLHAFDAAKLSVNEEGTQAISVRGATKDEKITTLTGEEYTLPEGTLLITDAIADAPIAIAGVKGGKTAEVTEHTTELIIEAANFDGASVRKTSQQLKLWTDASLRFQNKISPELAAYGMRDVLALILELAGGTLEGVTESYPHPETPASPVSVTLAQVNGLIGAEYTIDDVAGALNRLSLEHVIEGEHITLRPPFERRDIVIWQDLSEEIGRTLGYDRVPPTPLPPMQQAPDQKRFAGIEALKDVLIEYGYTEISTQSFAEAGDIALANPLQQERPWLRASLAQNMEEALARAASVAPRALGPEPALKLFEIGTVFTNDGEYLSLVLGYKQLSGKPSSAVLAEAVDALLSTYPAAGIQRVNDTGTGVVEISLKDADLESIGEGYAPARIALGKYQPFSIYPAALRDIAVWTPSGTEESEVALLIEQEAGALLARLDLFDRFEKQQEDGTLRTSYAFRLVFQADDRTLSDADLDPVMARITYAINAREGWQVR
jgi:phenylalanyl-tRNA synthetase beta chain